MTSKEWLDRAYNRRFHITISVVFLTIMVGFPLILEKSITPDRLYMALFGIGIMLLFFMSHTEDIEERTRKDFEALNEKLDKLLKQ